MVATCVSAMTDCSRAPCTCATFEPQTRHTLGKCDCTPEAHSHRASFDAAGARANGVNRHGGRAAGGGAWKLLGCQLMAKRSIWNGTLHVGKSAIEVKLYAAVEDEDVHFHLLHESDQERVRQHMVNPTTGE